MKKGLIPNDSKVVAHTEDNKTYDWKMGELKQAFLSGSIGYTILFVYFPRKNKNYYVSYNPTKGFRYTELSNEDIQKIREENKRK
jgi:hypothetical protein